MTRPTPPVIPLDLEEWGREGMTLNHRKRAVFRRGVITLIVAQMESGAWSITKMRGGRVISERELPRIESKVEKLIRDAIRASRMKDEASRDRPVELTTS